MIDLAKKALELARKATEGPWIINGKEGGFVCLFQVTDDKIEKWLSSPSTGINRSDPDMEFIAFSRDALPNLARHVIELEAKLNVARKAMLHYVSMDRMIGGADPAMEDTRSLEIRRDESASAKDFLECLRSIEAKGDE